MDVPETTIRTVPVRLLEFDVMNDKINDCLEISVFIVQVLQDIH